MAWKGDERLCLMHLAVVWGWLNVVLMDRGAGYSGFAIECNESNWRLHRSYSTDKGLWTP